MQNVVSSSLSDIHVGNFIIYREFGVASIANKSHDKVILCYRNNSRSTGKQAPQNTTVISDSVIAEQSQFAIIRPVLRVATVVNSSRRSSKTSTSVTGRWSTVFRLWQTEGTKILNSNRLKGKIRCQVGIFCQHCAAAISATAPTPVVALSM